MFPSDDGVPYVVALYLRVAGTLERSAELAEDHARRCRDRGQQPSADLERERAKRARMAAQRGRALAQGLQASDAHRDDVAASEGGTQHHGDDPRPLVVSGQSPSGSATLGH